MIEMSESNGNGSGNGRNADGTFALGWRGGPGRPRREVERQYLEATIGAIPVDRWRNVVAKAVDDAEAGDPKAREWLGKALGIDAPQKIAHTDSDGEPLPLARLLAEAHNVASAPRTESVQPLNVVVDVDAELASLEHEKPNA